MAKRLSVTEDMHQIYIACQKVYNKELSVKSALATLSPSVDASDASLKMYFNIYSSMRQGKCYKMGTSESFTKYLLEHIFCDNGKEALITALIAAKTHSLYRESVNNAQPGIEKACRTVIQDLAPDIDYDALVVASPPETVSETEDDTAILAEFEKLRDAITLSNKEFSDIIMGYLQTHQILSDKDISNLLKQPFCRQHFSSDYPFLRKIDTNCDITPQLKDKTGRNRYYSTIYELNSNQYVMTSQLYGLGENPTHRDNRKPFHQWILTKALDALSKNDLQKPGTSGNEDDTTLQFIGGEEEVPVLAKEYMKPIKDYIAAKGFSYDGRLIENFYLSLKTKPFVILAGTSGTGKTRLVKLFAEAIGAEYKLVPVRPDWSDSSDLFGHMDLNGKFVPGAVIDFIKSAQDHPGKPYFLCLDEMNLARVEYYLSDVLSVIETRDLNGKIITSDPLIDLDKYGSDEKAKAKYGKICFPQNLYIVGTVNMDETTFPFSKKVLDRANTIEFNFVDLRPSFDAITDMPDKLQLPNSFLQSEYLLLAQCNKDVTFVSEICNELQQINEILQKANAHIGYRVRDEIVFYLLNNKNEGELLSRNEAMDNAIMQKILPRIQGSSASIHDMLCELFKICGGDHNQRSGDSDADKMWKVVSDSSANCKYPNSAKKLQMMVRRFEEDGFTSFWL